MHRGRGWALLLAGVLAGLSFTAAAADGRSVREPLQPVLSGTVHQALFAMAFDGLLGIAVGASGEIQESTDGGQSWRQVSPAPTQLALLGVAVRGPRAIAVGQSGLILVRGADGGWRQVQGPSSERLMAVALDARGQALAVGAFGTVLVSADAGQQWRQVRMRWADHAEDGMQPHLYVAKLDADGALLVAGEFGLILRSRDSAQNWQRLHRGEASLFALHLGADGVGYAVGQNGVALRTRDGGTSWEALETGTQAVLLSVHATAQGRVTIMAIRDMLVSEDQGQSWQRLDSPLVKSAWWAALAQASDTSPLLAAGQAGQIVRVQFSNDVVMDTHK